MAYTSRHWKYYNSEEVIVKSFNDKHATLTRGAEDVIIETKETKNCKLVYAITCHKAQGQTMDKPHSIYEYRQMKRDMLYVCLTRIRHKEFVNCCEIEILKPHTGYMYGYSYNGKSYTGSANNIKHTTEEHTLNNTNKIGRAIHSLRY